MAGIRGVSSCITPPAGGGLALATPSINITTTGVADVQEEFTVSGGVDEVVTFSDGSDSGDATFDSMGNVSGANPPGPYFPTGSTGSPSYSFRATNAGEKNNMAKTSGGGGSVVVDIEGVNGAAETTNVSFGGATGGVVKFNGSAWIDFNVDASTFSTSLGATGAQGTNPIVTGSDGEFTVIASDDGVTPKNGVMTTLVVTENLLML